MELGEDIRALHGMSADELGRWVEASGHMRYGTWAPVVRALTWLRRDARALACADIDRALDKTPCFEWVELVCAILLFVAHEHERALALLDAIAERHLRLAGRCTKLARERRARLGGSAGAGPIPGEAHADDGRDLALAASLILHAAGQERRGAVEAQASGPSEAPALSQAELDGFARDGYVHLRGAVAREAVEATVADAQRRLEREPARWLSNRGGSLGDAFAGYRADDPATWPAGRADLRGAKRVPIAEVSPRAARAIDQLLGGRARPDHRWSDDLIIQFPTVIDEPRPLPGSPSWHLDAPSERTRLDQLRTGLLVLILYSDLRPRSGNTWLCPDSIPAVARLLARHREGVDFVSRDTARAITRKCRRFVEVTGAAGDVLLVHPLTLHAASPNPSPRVRWLGNPMVYVDAPLDHRRADPSPVEQLIASAL